VLVSRAVVRHELGRLSGAQDDLDRATPLVGPECAAEVVLQQAALHQNIGRLWAAARLYREVLERPTCPPDVRVKATNNLALLEVGLGRWDAALAHVEQAVRLAADLGPAPHAIVTQSRAWVTMQVGRLPESLRRFEQAGVLYERAGLPLAEHYIEYADALVELRLLPEAQVVADRAAAELRRWSARLMAPEAELRAARLHLLGGRGEPALAAARAAATQLGGRAAQPGRHGPTSPPSRRRRCWGGCLPPACAGSGRRPRRSSAWGCARTPSRATWPRVGWASSTAGGTRR
jgi:tetratricopeptide (TPR) repeat protein